MSFALFLPLEALFTSTQDTESDNFKSSTKKKKIITLPQELLPSEVTPVDWRLHMQDLSVLSDPSSKEAPS